MTKGEKAAYSSQRRIVDIYNRLLTGEEISVPQLSFEYGKHSETVKDDIRHIRFILEQQHNSIIYSTKQNTYSLEKNRDFLKSGDIFILLLLLYQSRSLIKKERIAIEEKLIALFSPVERQKLKKFFRSYDFHYSTVQQSNITQKINNLFSAILEQRQILLLYKTKERLVNPLTITFHDHQFYLVAELVGKNFDKPTNFRIDKIEKIEILNEKFRLNKKDDYFKPGEYNNQSFNMYSGDEVTVRLKVANEIEEYVYRKFPLADKIETVDDRASTFEVKVLGTEGILFWILGQQDKVEVLAPKDLRDKVKEKITKMLRIYNE